MYTVANPKSTRPVQRGTWYYMTHQDEALSFGLDYPHFVARAGRMRTGIVSDGSFSDMSRIQEQQIATSGTVLEMIDLFAEGAVISFYDPSVAHVAYKRIMDHLKAHQVAMREDLTYDAPDVDEFRRFAEFAVSIRLIAMQHVPDIDNERRPKSVHRHLRQVIRFSDSLKAAEAKREDHPEDIPAPIKKLDAIERFLEMIDNAR